MLAALGLAGLINLAMLATAAAVFEVNIAFHSQTGAAGNNRELTSEAERSLGICEREPGLSQVHGWISQAIREHRAIMAAPSQRRS